MDTTFEQIHRIKRFFLPVLAAFALFFFLFGPAPIASAQNVMHFPDENLEQAIRDELDQPADVITPNDLRQLQSLDADRREIRDLSGLEQATRLQSLNLYQNQVRDLSPLESLNSLQALYLGDNRIQDLSPLENMTRLETLHVGHNPVRNIEVVQNLGRLSELRLENTPVRNLTPLHEINRLETLYLDGVDADFSLLAELDRLRELSMAQCDLQDIAFLEELTGLTRLDLQENQLQDIEPLAELTQLEELDLENNRITDLAPLTGLNSLASLNLRGNDLEEIEAVQQIQNLVWVDLRDNYLDLAQDTPAAETVEALEAAGIEVFYDPQKLPFFQGNGLVAAPEGSGGKLLRTPAPDRFRLLNPTRGWRIKGFTIAHEDGKPFDFIAQIGRQDSRGWFSWHELSRSNPVNVDEKLPHTTTLTQASGTNLALGVQLWPGYANDDERLFYFSEIKLENIDTGDTYTLELDPDTTGNYTGEDHLLTRDHDFEETRDLDNLDELQETLAGALENRDPALSVLVDLPAGLDLEPVLEDLFERIYEDDDYLRYSMERKTMQWVRENDATQIDFRFGYHATGEEEEVVDEKVDEILEEIITPEMDPHEITKAVHDYIVANTAYDQAQREHSAYAALVKGRAVCQGYALLLYKMLNEAGVEARIISGVAGGENHAWNLVQLDGNWYHLDATWNDPIPDEPGRVLYDYYNRTDEQMRETHTWEEGEYPEADTEYEIWWQ